MNRRLFLFSPLALAACSRAGDVLIGEAITPAERVFRLAIVRTALSEVLVQKATRDLDLAWGYLGLMNTLSQRLDELDPESLFFETDLAKVMGAFKEAIVEQLREHLLDIVKAAAGSRGAQIGLALDAIGAVSKVGSLSADAKRIMARIDVGELTLAQARERLDMRTESNTVGLKALAELRR